MAWLTKIINFILYSNLWIAIAAITMTTKTFMLMDIPYWKWDAIYGFVFSATLFIYAGHRVIGLQKSEGFKDKGRYKVIADYKSHIIVYAVLGAIGTLVFASFLSWKTLGLMTIPGIISLAYIFPIWSRKDKKRLRDIDDVKIYFVALVWTVVTVVLPFIEKGNTNFIFLLIASLEVFFFVFAITIPFDIRDLNIDGTNKVKTIPARIGEKKSKYLALLLLILSFNLGILNIYCHSSGNLGSSNMILSYSISYLITFLLIFYSEKERDDYYYTGLMDGTMIFLPLIMIGFHVL